MRCEVIRNPLSHNLPSGFTEVEQLGLPTSQYLNTGIAVSDITRVKFKAKANLDERPTADFHFFAGATSYKGAGEGYGLSGSSKGIWKPVGSGISWSETVECDFNITTTTFSGTINGVSESGTFSLSGGNLLINTPAQMSSDWIVEYFEIYTVQGLVRNYKPCHNDTTDKFGMYDLVSQTFFGNSGRGAFTGGNVVEKFILKPVNTCEVVKSKNLFDIDDLWEQDNSWLNDSNVVGTSPAWHISKYVAVKPNTTYHFRFLFNGTSSSDRIFFYSEDKGSYRLVARQGSLPSGVVWTKGQYVEFDLTTRSTEYWIRLSAQKVDGDFSLVSKTEPFVLQPVESKEVSMSRVLYQADTVQVTRLEAIVFSQDLVQGHQFKVSAKITTDNEDQTASLVSNPGSTTYSLPCNTGRVETATFTASGTYYGIQLRAGSAHWTTSTATYEDVLIEDITPILL